MANINIENISDSNLNGNDLFEDSESFITELDDNEQAIMGGYGYCGFYTAGCGFTGGCGLTQIGNCGNTIGQCGNTVNVG